MCQSMILTNTRVSCVLIQLYLSEFMIFQFEVYLAFSLPDYATLT